MAFIQELFYRAQRSFFQTLPGHDQNQDVVDAVPVSQEIPRAYSVSPFQSWLNRLTIRLPKEP